MPRTKLHPSKSILTSPLPGRSRPLRTLPTSIRPPTSMWRHPPWRHLLRKPLRRRPSTTARTGTSSTPIRASSRRWPIRCAAAPQAFGFSDKIGQILIPTEEVVELRSGKKVTSKRLLYPGYVLVEMEMNDELWHDVKATPRVTGFVGGGNSPVPLSSRRSELDSVSPGKPPAERPRPKMTFEKNENVRIIDGPFANFSGKMDEVNPERNTLRVLVTIFGRATPVELDFLQVEKI